MPWRCCVPGCKGYDEARSMGVVFHGLPTRDPPRCRAWLRAIQNPRLDEDTPVSRYSGVRVCSLHFTPEDYEEDFRAKILNTAPKPVLKSGAVPSVFPGRERGEPGCTDTEAPAPKRARTQTPCGAAASSSQPPVAAAVAAASDESFCIVVSVDPLDDSFQSEPEFNSKTTSDESDEDVDEDCTVVYNRSLMELFRMCQTCGQPIHEKEAFHSGAQMRVRWSCRGGHSGTWKSSPHLRDVLP
ncbi:THAP domain-containing protein 7-like [Dicentrarchus labrax]|uniref:THAP domain-containing protein 7-like n=1 Tax=Dicentrarchus labrax TaxID=13489 RepID=UPI0016392694|nr:THAP domain-containing protein 7-like [Dicentrarchus labrax]XP_051255361.1 THAP domain-containing protein 7-like [Dicentrarchus labrax]